MKKFDFIVGNGDVCPYKSFIALNGYCSSCKYHIKKIYNNIYKGYVLCRYNSFSDKIKIIKEILK